MPSRPACRPRPRRDRPRPTPSPCDLCVAQALAETATRRPSPSPSQDRPRAAQPLAATAHAHSMPSHQLAAAIAAGQRADLVERGEHLEEGADDSLVGGARSDRIALSPAPQKREVKRRRLFAPRRALPPEDAAHYKSRSLSQPFLAGDSFCGAQRCRCQRPMRIFLPCYARWPTRWHTLSFGAGARRACTSSQHMLDPAPSPLASRCSRLLAA